MKKNILLFYATFLFIVTTNAQNKAFHNGIVTIDFGVGLSIYGNQIHKEYDTKMFNGTIVKSDQNNSDGAVATVIPFTLEYGVTNWLGVGGRFAYSKYINNADSTKSNTTPEVRGLDGSVFLNLHLIKSKRFDMPISFMIGYSNFKYDANNPNPIDNLIATDNGLNYGISLIPRFYFGNHIGVFFNLGYMGYNYPSISISSNLNQLDYSKFSIKGDGGNIGVGLIIKI